MNTIRSRAAAPLIVTLAALFGLTGCGVTAEDLPLPGSKVSGPTYELTAVFDDALNLPTGAHVKENGVTIGRVQKVVTKNFKARATLVIKKQFPLREGTAVMLRPSTPLGELYVQVDSPAKGPKLGNGALITNKNTSASPTIEDTMAAAALLLNGGSLAQLQTIVRETNTILNGNEETIRSLLGELQTFTTGLNQSTSDIDKALAALNGVSKVLKRRQASIDKALTEIRPAAKVLTEQTPDITELLTKTDRLATITKRGLDRTRADLLNILRKLEPLTDRYLELSDELGPGMRDMVRFARLLDRAVPGDYLNVDAHVHLENAQLGDDYPQLPGLPDLGDDKPDVQVPNLPSIPELPLPLSPPQSNDQTKPEQPDVEDLLGLDGLLGVLNS